MNLPTNSCVPLVFAALLVMVCPGFAAEVAPQKTKSFARQIAGILLTVKVPEEAVTSAEAVLDVTITNSSAERIQIAESHNLLDCIITIVDAKGEECKLTARGEQIVGRQQISCGLVGLDPKGSRNWRFPLASLFELHPGAYRFTLSLRFPVDYRTLEVEKLPLTIRGSD